MPVQAREAYGAFLEAQINEKERRRRGYLAPKIGHAGEGDFEPTPPGGGILALGEGRAPRRLLGFDPAAEAAAVRQVALRHDNRRALGAVRFGGAQPFPYVSAPPGWAANDPAPLSARKRQEAAQADDGQGGFLWRLGLGGEDEGRRQRKLTEQDAYRSALDDQVRQRASPPRQHQHQQPFRPTPVKLYQPAYALPPPPQPFAPQPLAPPPVQPQPPRGAVSAPVTPGVPPQQDWRRPLSGGGDGTGGFLWRLGLGQEEQGRRRRKSAVQDEYKAALDQQMRLKTSPQRDQPDLRAPGQMQPLTDRGGKPRHTAPGERVVGREDFSYGRLGPRRESDRAEQHRREECARAWQAELDKQIEDKKRRKKEEEERRRESDLRWEQQYGSPPREAAGAPRTTTPEAEKRRAEKRALDRQEAAQALKDPRFAPVRKKYHHEVQEGGAAKDADEHPRGPIRIDSYDAIPVGGHVSPAPSRRPSMLRRPQPRASEPRSEPVSPQQQVAAPPPAAVPVRSPPPPLPAPPPPPAPPPEPAVRFAHDFAVGLPTPVAPPLAPLLKMERLELRNRHRLSMLGDLVSQLHGAHRSPQAADRVLRDFVRSEQAAEPAWLSVDVTPRPELAASPTYPAAPAPLLPGHLLSSVESLQNEASYVTAVESPQGWAAGALAVESSWVQAPKSPPPSYLPIQPERSLPSQRVDVGVQTPDPEADEAEAAAELAGAVEPDAAAEPEAAASSEAVPPDTTASPIGPPPSGAQEWSSELHAAAEHHTEVHVESADRFEWEESMQQAASGQPAASEAVGQTPEAAAGLQPPVVYHTLSEGEPGTEPTVNSSVPKPGSDRPPSAGPVGAFYGLP
eukprot:TRINITY_DN26265_c0_g1_i2.p1 TRINITY_DN26265_c0_g1~~TRINITY_DN26265_c0_g1_i2.p1  ORF type:complete len:850 (+),score=272.02 TRINITY_DN26265_c0_g1_i2:74-2623(+)